MVFIRNPGSRGALRPRIPPLTPSQGGGAWWLAGSLWSADYENGRFRDPDGARYSIEDDFNVAMGGATKSGEARTFSPYVVGTELTADGGFSSGVDSWDDAPTYSTYGDVAQVGNALRLSWTGVDTQYRARRPTTTVSNRAYLFSLLALSRVDVTTALVSASNNMDMNGAVTASFTVASLPETKSVVYGAVATTSYFGSNNNGPAAATTRIDVDDASIKECYPYKSFTPDSLSAQLTFTTPAVASGNKVLAQWGDDGERTRIRLVWESSTNLRLIVTRDNTEVANLDMGTVAVSTRHTVKFAATTNRASASLDGGALVTDTSLTFPAVGRLRLGRSPTGETWDGTIHRIDVWAEALSDAALTDPLLSFYVFGDSTAAATGASSPNRWFDVLATAYSPDRTARSAGVGGENTTQMLARVQADVDHRLWTTIFIDRPNTGETSTEWLANMKAAAALIPHSRWLVVPPVLNSPSGLPDTSGTAIGEVQAALLSDPFFSGHTFSASQQAAYVSEMADDATRVGTGDYTHFNTAGQALQAARIKTTLDALGW